MIADVVGRRYAKALFALASKEQTLDEVRDSLDSIVHLMDTNRTFRYFMLTPRIEKERKRDLFRKVVGPGMPEVMHLFLGVVLEKRRQEYLDKIRKHFDILYNESIGRVLVHAVSAYLLSPEEQQALVHAFEVKTGKQILLSNTVDPSLIGGIHVRMGYTIIDTTIKGKLIQMKKLLSQSL